MGEGRVTIAIHDADAVPDATTALRADVRALMSGTQLDLALSPSSAGMASRTLDLVLADPNAAPPAEGKRAPQAGANASEINVVGDDIVRISYTDAHVATADLQTRRTATSEELKAESVVSAKPAVPAGEEASVVPIITLRDPQRTVAAQQDKQLADLKTEMNGRLGGYVAERELFQNRRAILAARPASKSSSDETTKLALSAIDTQIALLTERTQRLKALGAVMPAATQPAAKPLAVKAGADPEPAAKPASPKLDPANAALYPGHPFDIVIDDPDLTADTVNVRLRSMAGRLVQGMSVPAHHHPDGTYRAHVETQRSGDPGDTKILSLLPDGEVIVDYEDAQQAAPAAAERFMYLALGTDAKVQVMNVNYSEEASQVSMGAPVYVQVTDYDADRSGALDQIAVTAKSDKGDSLIVILTETEAHSGVFRGKFLTDNGKPNAGDDLLQANYSAPIQIMYNDYLRQSPDSPIEKTVEIRVAGGTDGTIEGFSRQFTDAKEEMRLWYTTGQSAYEIGRKLYTSGATARAEEYLTEASDYFNQLVSRFPDDALAASSNYYLGNILALKGDDREALARYQEIINRWPKSEFVAKSRFKSGQCLERLGQFDQATDAYVLLAYHHPGDAHVPMAMVRMMNFYAKQQQWPDAVAVAEKFVEKFPQHEQAGAVALKAGQWLMADTRPRKALAWFTSCEKTFATNDKEMPALLYWHAATLIGGGERIPTRGEKSEKIRELLNRVVYDYPTNEYAKLAQVALDQILKPQK